VNLPQGLRALRYRNFRLFFVGQGVSQIGSWLQMIATSWLVYHLSGSAFLLGLSAFALQIPFFVLAPLAGVFIDRLDRRGVLVATNWIAAVQALAMFLVVALGVAEPWHFIAGNLVLGIVNAFNAPHASRSCSSWLAEKAIWPTPSRSISVMMNGARFVGPLIGGALIATLGERWSFGLNVASYLVMLAALAQMRLPPRRHVPSEHGWRRELVAGARYAFGFFPRAAPAAACRHQHDRGVLRRADALVRARGVSWRLGHARDPDRRGGARCRIGDAVPGGAAERARSVFVSSHGCLRPPAAPSSRFRWPPRSG